MAYIVTEKEEITINGSATINNAYKIDELEEIQGNTTQANTPTPTSPQPINVVSGRQDIVVAEKNLLNYNLEMLKANNTNGTWNDNVYTFHNVSFTLNNDLSITVSGEANADTTFYINRVGGNYKSTILQPATYYLTSHEYTGSNSTWKMQYSLENWGNVYGTGANKELVKTTTSIVNATATIYVYDGKNPNGTTFYPMIAKESGIDYETYKGSTYNINLTGTNLFNENILINNYIIDTSGNLSPSTNYVVGDYIRVKPNTNYTISYTRISGTDGMRIGEYQSDYTFIARPYSANNPYTFTTPSNCYYLRLTYNKTLIEKIQLQEGSTATDYETYHSIELCKINDYKDGIYKSNGTWYLHKEIGKVVLNGSENWVKSSNTSVDRFYLDDASFNMITRSSGYSNYFVVSTTVTADIGKYYTNVNQVVINYSTYNTTTLQQFKTWLSTHNTIVYYVLSTPTTTEITDTELISQLESIELLSGLNNISITSGDLAGTYKLSYYIKDNNYYNNLYSQDSRNKLKILFNGVELENADVYCEKIDRVARILPNDGNKVFSLDNFISTSLEVVLHNVDIDDIQDQVEISIGTLTDSINNIYKYVPLGVFNIQDKPENDNGKITLKLRDNRVKFDFNYNAKPLIDSLGGVATKKQILNDICDKAGVVNRIESFNGENDTLAIFDNTIQASNYVAYLMEQAGLIATINRYGELIAVDLNESYKWQIPLNILESGYEISEPYKIDRVVYESGIIKYETSDDESLDTLYLSASNPYITMQGQVDYIYNKFKDFQIDSVLTKRCLGNPCIDAYDFIEIYNNLDNSNDVMFKTLANTSYTYNGKHQDVFDTQISKEQRTENVSLKSDASFQTYAKTTINNLTADVNILSVKTQNLEDGTYTKQQVDDLLVNADTGVTNTFKTSGGNNIFRNTGLWFTATTSETMLYPNSDVYPSDDLFMGNQVAYEFWSGSVEKVKNDKAVNMSSMLLMNDILSQEQLVPNGTYTISFKYKKRIALSNISVKINDVVYPLESNEEATFVQTIEVSLQHISLQFISDIDESCEIYDLMVNSGDVALAYSQNANETTTDTVNISKGITITSSDTDVKFKADVDGIRTLDKSENVLTKFTDTGMTTKEAIIQSKSQIVGTLWQEVGGQTWITRL